MSDGDSPSWRRKRAERVRQKETAARKRQESEQDQKHVQIVAALNGIANEHRASRYQEHAYEGKKGSRETLTIVGIFAAAVVALGTLIYAHRDTMHGLKEARIASGRQHDDTQAALKIAAEANRTARTTAAAQVQQMTAQAEAAKIQAAAAKSAAETARETLIASQRPWVFVVNAAVSSPLIINEYGGHLTVKFDVKNAGHSPAAHVVPVVQMFTRSFDAHEMASPRADCAKARDRDVEVAPSGITISPDQVSGLSVNFVISPTDLDRLRPDSDPSTTVMVAGCVDYVFEFAPEHHQTGLVYEVDIAAAGGAIVRADPNEKSVAAGNVLLMVNPRLAGNAD